MNDTKYLLEQIIQRHNVPEGSNIILDTSFIVDYGERRLTEGFNYFPGYNLVVPEEVITELNKTLSLPRGNERRDEGIRDSLPFLCNKSPAEDFEGKKQEIYPYFLDVAEIARKEVKRIGEARERQKTYSKRFGEGYFGERLGTDKRIAALTYVLALDTFTVTITRDRDLIMASKKIKGIIKRTTNRRGSLFRFNEIVNVNPDSFIKLNHPWE